MPKQIRVAIVDAQPLMRAGIQASFYSELDFEVVGTGGNYDDALKIASTLAPDMIIMDVIIPGGGIQAARLIAKRNAHVRILFLTTSERNEDVTAALEAGVCAYILKGIDPGEFVRTLRVILAGETFIMPQLATRLLVAAARAPAAALVAANPLRQLTARELQILKHVSTGNTNKEIARSLTITEKTVKHYMSSILQKLSVRNRTEAVIVMQASTRTLVEPLHRGI